MLYKLLVVLYGATLLQNVWMEVASPIETTTLQRQIMKILSPFIISNTSGKICLGIFESDWDIETCFAETFPTASTITRNITEICLDLNLPKLEIFVKTRYHLEELDENILAGCLHSLPGKISSTNYADFIRILQSFSGSNIFPETIQKLKRDLLLQLLSVVKNNNSTFTHISSDMIFKAWRPFAEDVIGIVTYPNQTYLELENGPIPSTADFDDLETMIYVPLNFLDKLVETVTAEEKMEVRLIILLIKNAEISESFLFERSEVLGIDFAGISLNNELTMIRIWYRTADLDLKWKEYDLNDFEPLGCAISTSTFRRMHFVYLSDRINEVYICPRTTIKRNSSRMTWSAAPAWREVYPDRFCMSEDCHIPLRFCRNGQYVGKFTWSEECYKDHYISRSTQELYEYVKCCSYNDDYCRADFAMDLVKSYIDVKTSIYFLLQDMTRKENFRNQIVFERTCDLLDKGLEFLEEEHKGVSYLSCVMNDLYGAFNNFPSLHTFHIKRRNYVFLSFVLKSQTDAIGFALYRYEDKEEFNNYHIRYITVQNVSYDYSMDDGLEAIVYLSIKSQNLLANGTDIRFAIAVLRNGDLLKDKSYDCRSRILVVYQYLWHAIEEGTVNLTVYLKTIDSKSSQNLNMFNNEGYWFNIDPGNYQARILCVSESSETICNSAKQLRTYTFAYYADETGAIPQIKLRNMTITQLDMLSQLAISMNPRMKNLFQDYFYILHIITLAESTLSGLGLISIFLSALILKGWCKKKFNTVQLSITLAFEIVFFVIDVDRMTHIGYLIFFYSILAQFAWMLIIGYIQYLKFVKVFTTSTIDTAKSLILGWLSPALIMLLPLVIYSDCLKCDLCYKNDQIFNYFVFGPASLIILTNMIIYLVVMYNILRVESGETSSEVSKAKLRAAILFPFLLGISWISIFALICPWSWISAVGSLMFHIVTPAQGFVLCVFVVFLDEDTRVEWRQKFSGWIAKIGCGWRNRKVEKTELKMA